ncbi:helix-turn-helix domain-containing protein [Hymenobacter persicinus]|uniref:DNA-binding protein n=1 Tax=Hymenobacter persicinus TaxID=2025506 RepID=A0A4Q5LFZ3_9BACT|nr:helix-turn-helix domain-containing protein [Hymenobacter persicinus]RYU83814.1 DNA-binding protein [Hymenobacter persicinus]
MKYPPPLQEATLIVLSLPQFQDLFNSLLDEKLSPFVQAIKAGGKQGGVEYMTTQQALDFMHLSKPTLNKLRREGRITAYNSSDKRVLYKRSELAAYLDAAKQKGGTVNAG